MFRMVRKTRLAVLLVLCLAAMTTVAQAQSSDIQVRVADCTSASIAYTAKCFKITTKPASAVRINLGTDKTYSVSTIDRLKATHRVTVRGLRPNTKYYGTVTVTPKTGKPKTVKFSPFQTAAPGSFPAKLAGKGNKLTLNGQPWFMVAASIYGSCPNKQVLDYDLALGVQVLSRDSGYSCSQTSDPGTLADLLHGVLNGEMFWDEHHPAGDTGVGPGEFPELLGSQMPTGQYPIAPTITIPCDAKGLGEPVLFDRVKEGSLHRPTIYSLSLVSTYGGSRKSCLSAANLERAFWLTVAAGGDGFEFATQDSNAVDGNGSGGFDVNADLRAQAKRSVLQLATLGPAVLTGKSIKTVDNSKDPVRYAAWSYGGAAYLIAVNTKDIAVRGTLVLPASFKTGLVQVMWERRNTKMTASGIVDQFGPAAVHLYKVTPRKKK